jgi:hypothetical protein
MNATTITYKFDIGALAPRTHPVKNSLIHQATLAEVLNRSLMRHRSWTPPSSRQSYLLAQARKASTCLA